MVDTMGWFRKESPPVVEPEATPEDFLREADANLRAAEREFAEAHFQTNAFYSRNCDYLPVKDVAGKVTITIKPPSAELAALLSRENHAIENRNRCMQRRVELRKRYLPETQYAAGQLVKPL
jgi:HEPN domain-containing protein